jgi:hypothetical protein
LTGLKRMLFPLKPFLRFCFLSFVLISLMGCASKTAVVPVRGPDDREVLEKRAREYWDLMIELSPQSVDKVYRYESPSFREKVSFPEYIHRFKARKYLTAEIKGIEIEGNKAKVALFLTYRVALPNISKALPKSEDEKWVKVEGTWYHIPSEWEMQD